MPLKKYVDMPPWEWPQDAGQQFKAVLKNKKASESDRLIAAELAGDFTVISDDLAGMLLAVLTDSSEPAELRAKSAISFGAALEQADVEGFDDAESIPISEPVFKQIQATLRQLYFDEQTPTYVRRRILEASVRAAADWHTKAILEAYASGDADWRLTAVFAMSYARGFDLQILESLNSKNVEVQVKAVNAAGTWELDKAWSRVVGFIEDAATPKALLLASIGAAAIIRPIESNDILVPLTDSPDEEIADAAEEALSEAGYMAHGFNEDAMDENGEWIN